MKSRLAVDGPGVRSVLDTVRKAEEKDLSIVSGLCWRYDYGVRETIGRVMDGAIGEIVAIQENYNAGPLWSYPRREGLVRHGIPDAELALLHLVVGRPQRRAAHPQPRQGVCG